MVFKGNPLAWAALAGAAGAAVWTTAALGACSSAPVKLECQELKARIDLGNLTEDQLRFAREELAECEGRLRTAQEKDSAFIDRAHESFTPDEAPDDAAPRDSGGTP